nr:MAG TPA: hypothetical protein [Caudoviricetes sp.]
MFVTTQTFLTIFFSKNIAQKAIRFLYIMHRIVTSISFPPFVQYYNNFSCPVFLSLPVYFP